jgi:hypothetical protein
MFNPCHQGMDCCPFATRADVSGGEGRGRGQRLDPYKPRYRTAQSLSIVAALGADGFLAWTVAVAVDRNVKDVLPPARPSRRARGRGPRFRRASRVPAPERAGRS